MFRNKYACRIAENVSLGTSFELTSVIVTHEPEVEIVQDGSMIKRFHGIVP